LSETQTTNKVFSIWLPLLLGIAAFLIIASPQFLDPTNVAWLIGGDSLQHYLGWAFYRNGPWTWPIGLNELYGMDFSNSIVFTDSIPLLAIPFKVLAPLLPYPFQYLGIWVLLCFMLQAYLAFQLIGLITSDLAIKCLGSILFLFSPPLIFRLGLHESLMAHFIILAALFLNLSNANGENHRKKEFFIAFLWASLLSVAAMTHFYLVIMVIFLWISDLCSRVFIFKSTSYIEAAIEQASIILLIGFVAWQAGYFAIESTAGVTRGFGDFRTNILALFNSRGWSYFLRQLPLRDAVEAATGEGFQYLGAGSLFLLLCSTYAVLRKKINLKSVAEIAWKKNRFLIIALVLLALISFSNNIGFGPWNLRVPLPENIITVFSLVRASSRLFWPMYYAILLLIIYVVVRAYSIKITLIVFSIAAVLQAFDTSAGWLNVREKISLPTSVEFKSSLQNPFWMAAGKHYSNIVTNGGNEHWGAFGILASANQMATNISYLARVDAEKMKHSFVRINQQLHQGPLDGRMLYILPDWKSSPDQVQYDSQKDLLARIDGINLLAPGWKACKPCSQVPKELELNQLAPDLRVGEVVDFTKSGNGRTNFMLGGWGFTEDWGTWATDSSAKLVFPMPEGNPSKLIIKAHAFLAGSHSEQVVDITVNGIRVADHMVLKQAKGDVLEVKLPRGSKIAGEPVMIEFRSQDAISPKDAGLGPDERKLGIGLVSIQFAR